jgi:hypothetical protein
VRVCQAKKKTKNVVMEMNAYRMSENRCGPSVSNHAHRAPPRLSMRCSRRHSKDLLEAVVPPILGLINRTATHVSAAAAAAAAGSRLRVYTHAGGCRSASARSCGTSWWSLCRC